MNFRQTAWAAAVTATLTLIALPAHADKREQILRLPIAQKQALDGLASDITQAPARQLMGQFVQPAIGLVPPEKREATGQQIDAELQKYQETATPVVKASAAKVGPAAVASVLEDKFTEEELKQLGVMLDSPVLKKYQSVIPELQKTLIDKVSADARSQVDPKLQALQDNIRKIIDTASGGKLSQAMANQNAAQGGDAPASKPAAKPAKK
ncbi:hypothetical protein EV672_101569 [Aquabacterium commune]|uniref:DUF2059 domain-containing protein n=1 Tax=Aquabacterium commune TaxID=70586 RepID=A0A4R6RP37_9BURK|nr:hypothetical protein [Aquabacterium commune]TDP88420.1 hypothetical protein EV672_101569 [Aquabacterium commune]